MHVGELAVPRRAYMLTRETDPALLKTPRLRAKSGSVA